MCTLNRVAIRYILNHLDKALADTRRDTPAGCMDSNASWRICMARDILLEAALADIAVEPMAEPMRVAA